MRWEWQGRARGIARASAIRQRRRSSWLTGRSAHAIFGSPDDLKFRSSMTLFAQAEPAEGRFEQALARYFEGEADPHTLALLRSS